MAYAFMGRRNTPRIEGVPSSIKESILKQERAFVTNDSQSLEMTGHGHVMGIFSPEGKQLPASTRRVPQGHFLAVLKGGMPEGQQAELAREMRQNYPNYKKREVDASEKPVVHVIRFGPNDSMGIPLEFTPGEADKMFSNPGPFFEELKKKFKSAGKAAA